MKKQVAVFSVGAVVVFLLALSVGLSSAQGMASKQAKAALLPQAQVGTAFTYQGQLLRSGDPVTATCNMVFRLYDAVSGGNQVGDAITTTVPVTAGRFTASLDFGSSLFAGEARWLGIAVQCPGDAAYTNFSQRQALTPAPYALYAPAAGNAAQLVVSDTVALRLQSSPGVPNLIGGYTGNTVAAANVEGAVIGGGGANGLPNRILSTDTSSFATISGGANNTIDGYLSTIGGGANNVTGDSSTTIAGGWTNTASAVNATVGGGQVNTASGAGAVVGGGGNNTASGEYATVSGGGYDLAGSGNTAGGDYAFVGGGSHNVAVYTYTTIAGGQG
ncbi:MAG: hypothetical protein JW934_05495, partial [Anaerolineae bacterium]|nr:hypothetical protein [Anaerolineae bacterium]